MVEISVALYSVSFADTNIGTAVGYGGIIIHTTDGGSTWTQQASGTTEILTDVSFTDINTWTIVGYYGTLFSVPQMDWNNMGSTDSVEQIIYLRSFALKIN